MVRAAVTALVAEPSKSGEAEVTNSIVTDVSRITASTKFSAAWPERRA